jgi:hypothetical protein
MRMALPRRQRIRRQGTRTEIEVTIARTLASLGIPYLDGPCTDKRPQHHSFSIDISEMSMAMAKDSQLTRNMC